MRDEDKRGDGTVASPQRMPKRCGTRLLGRRSIGGEEGRCALLFFAYAFVLLVCYYVLKTLREPLLLVDAAPEIKSYAYAAIAALLIGVVPLYNAISRRMSKSRLSWWVTIFFISNLLVFYVVGRSGVDIGFAYYLWVGVFNVTILAQLWAHAVDCFDLSCAQRLFPRIMIAAAIGSIVGASIVAALFVAIGPWKLLLVATLLLTGTLPLIRLSTTLATRHARQGSTEPPDPAAKLGGGLLLMCRDRYLLLMAALVVLLNCVNTTGEFLLADFVVELAGRSEALDAPNEQAATIATFYGFYYSAINVVATLMQVLVVGRLIRWVGVDKALLVLPFIALAGYGLIFVVPVFGMLQAFKVVENSVDYSIMNTSRHMLFLPLSRSAKYPVKMAIDTFVYRLGDLLQALIVFSGLHLFGLSVQGFALLNMGLAVAWVLIARELGRRYAAFSRTYGVVAASAAPIAAGASGALQRPA